MNKKDFSHKVYINLGSQMSSALSVSYHDFGLIPYAI